MSRSEVLRLYKNLMRESQRFTSYNFRMYAVRRVRDAFKEAKSLDCEEVIAEKYQFGIENLNMLKRQVVIGQMYQSHKLVIENT